VAESDASRLFIERAQAVLPTFNLTQQNATALARVCERLDGIPLALELAAVRVRALTVEQLAARLDDRFRLLTGGSRTALPRQQTLRALIDWSYDLLSAGERTLLRRLAVFAGGWTEAAAVAVCGEAGEADSPVPELLIALVSKSLVGVVGAGDERRYRLLETIRQYARDKLFESGEAAALRARHLAWFLALAESLPPQETPTALAEQIEADHDNLRAAFEWGLAGDQPDQAARIAGRLLPFWELRGYWNEARARLESALARVTAPTADRAQALLAVARIIMLQGDFEQAVHLNEESLALYRQLPQDATTQERMLDALTGLAALAPDVATAHVRFQEILDLSRQRGAPVDVATNLHKMGDQYLGEGDGRAALAMFTECRAILETLDEPRLMAYALRGLGHSYRLLGQYAEAAPLLQDSLRRCRELGDVRGIMIALSNSASLRWAQGDLAAAAVLWQELIAMARELGTKMYATMSTIMLGVTTYMQGHYAEAATRLEEGLAVAQAGQNSGAEAAARAWLARLALAQRDPTLAEAHIAVALDRMIDPSAVLGVVLILEAWSEILAQIGAEDAATGIVEVLGAVDAHRVALGLVVPPVEQPARARTEAALRATLGEAAFARAWAAGQGQTLADALALARTADRKDG
jgi:non-specific serine/threonine protein kinase